MDGLLTDKEPTEVIHSWGRKYWAIGGWGKLFALWLASPNPEPYGSYGNGAAMRIAAVGWVAQSENELIQLATQFTEVTHNHPDGITAAIATALAVYYARIGHSSDAISQALSPYYQLDFTIAEIRDSYKRTEVAKDSVPQAIVCALEASSFEDAIRKAVSLNGDTDTQAAIAGAIAEARFGMPDDIVNTVRGFLNDEMKLIVDEFYDRYVNS
jgi:ADP-ribosylglycohydrolase